MSTIKCILGVASIFFLPALCSSLKGKLQVELVAVGIKAKEQVGQLLYLGPPMSVAADYVNTVYNESLNLTLTYEIEENPLLSTLLSNEYTPRLVAEWYYRKRVSQRLSILLIPAASVLSDMTYMFQQWNILFITVTSVAPAISDRISNPTWISTARINFPAMTLLFCEVVLKYGWTTFMTVLDLGSGGIYRTFATKTIEDFIDLTGRAPLQRRINTTTSSDFQGLLQDIRAHTRIVILFGTGGVVRDFLIAANNANMTKGDYVYMAFEVADNPKMYGRLHWKYQDENDMVAQQAFQSLLIMRPQDIYDPPNTDLAKRFMARTQRDFNYSYPIKDEPYQNMLACYTAVTMVAQVLDELWINGNEYELQNGAYLADQFLNRTFDNHFSEIYIDDKGGRQMDAYMWRFDENGTQSRFLYKDAAHNASVVELYKIKQWVDATWPPANEPPCGFTNNRQSCRPEVRSSSSVVPAVLGVILICIVAVFVGIRYARRVGRGAEGNWWNIDQTELQYIGLPLPTAMSFHSIGDHKSVSQNTAPYLEEKFFSGKLKGVDVLVESVETPNECNVLSRIASDRFMLRDLDNMRNLGHVNISRFYGITVLASGVISVIGVVTEWVGRGCIYDVFDGMANLDATLISSLANDFLEGVQFIHSSGFGYHGCLCGAHCHVDKHFTLKISGLVSYRLQIALHGSGTADNNTMKRFPFCGRDESGCVDQKQKVDIQAVGVVLRELFTKQRQPSTEDLAAENVIAMEPGFLQDCQHILVLCCSNDLDSRPSIKQVREKLAEKNTAFSIHQSRIKLIDKIQKRLIDYTRDLENEVGLRTKNLLDEIARCNEIVALFLPRWAANQIRLGNHVQAELFDCASVIFTQICGFGNVLVDNDPKNIIDVLQESEAMVDRLIESFSEEIYKVEAVQDCYMAVSGLPVKNGDYHSQVTAELAIQLQQSTPPFFVHFDLQLKSGIHSGPCAAGVLGTRRLRYCLFGDTVNTAARMCSYGSSRCTQITQCTASMLKKTELFEIEYRGVISVKGKSDMETYWLHGYSKKSI